MRYLLVIWIIEDAAKLMKNAGGILILAHPNVFKGPSLRRLTNSLNEQSRIIEESLLKYLDGIECWHTHHNTESTKHYLSFVRQHSLIATGGSDCHQKRLLMGTIDIPKWVAEQEVFKS